MHERGRNNEHQNIKHEKNKTTSFVTHSWPSTSTPTKVCFIDGKSSSLHSRMSGHQWKYITERKQSTSASILAINLRLRGPCRICEKTRSRWWEWYVTLKDTPSKMGFRQHRNEGDGSAREGGEGDEAWICEGQQIASCLRIRFIFSEPVNKILGEYSWFLWRD